MANKTALCRECQCVIAANGVEGHILWHCKLASAIVLASGINTTPEYIKMVEDSTRLAMQGRITVVW